MLFEMIHLFRTRAGYAGVALLSARGFSPLAQGRLQIRRCHPGRGGGADAANDLIVFVRLLCQSKDGVDGLVLG
jgi:hypothetical protein